MIPVYLHGFNSAAKQHSPIVVALTQAFGPTIQVTYDSFAKYQEVQQQILSHLPENETFLLTGTSLGGFWAATLGKLLNMPSVAFNPATNPEQQLRHHVGIRLTNFVTGFSNTLSNDTLESYRDKDLFSCVLKSMIRPLILLDADDEVFSSNATYEMFRSFGNIYIYPGGSHRFQNIDAAISRIKTYVQHVSTTAFITSE